MVSEQLIRVRVVGLCISYVVADVAVEASRFRRHQLEEDPVVACRVVRIQLCSSCGMTHVWCRVSPASPCLGRAAAELFVC